MIHPISRRISYILPNPSPDEPPPLLALPELGCSKRGHPRPFLIPKLGIGPPTANLGSRNPFNTPNRNKQHDPKHCLGVNALALDTTTILEGENSPRGILYTGGRDGLVASWDLNIPHTHRSGPRYSMPDQGSQHKSVKWERIGDSSDFFLGDEDDDKTSGNSKGSVADNGTEEGWVDTKKSMEVPFEDRYEIDRVALAQEGTSKTMFRQSIQTHTDWVNALLLCNHNRTVITASSDRTIRAWTPHSTSNDPHPPSPSLIGTHVDYVKALAWAKETGNLWSGSLDRKICLWDVSEGVGNDPILTINLEPDKGDIDRGSVYALGVDYAGNVLAAGTSERTVKLWDPRVGATSLAQLIGHEDRVRSILFSEDGKYMLTASSDTTIKLWSISARRCLHTFTHHTSSVWSLFSSHPNLERFYSGSRDGCLCAVDLEGCGDMSDGECVVLAKEGYRHSTLEETKTGDEGIRAIVAMDDEYVWTSNGDADIHRWRDVGRKFTRLDEPLDDARFHSSKEKESLMQNTTAAAFPGPVKRVFFGSEANSLFRTETRDSKTVAFVEPPHSESDSLVTSAMSTSIRGRLDRRSTLSNTSIVSQALSGDDESTHLNGVPYASLVPLSLVEGPYAFGPTSAPIVSIPRGSRNGEVSPKRNASVDSASAQRFLYLQREDTSEARPLHSEPDEKGSIQGRSGLIRSSILNDRQHALTLDTEGGILLWNIISGQCVGTFDSSEVLSTLHLDTFSPLVIRDNVRKHSEDVLDLVKGRIEGETSVLPWCSLDTRIGSLVIHLEESRVWDAEIYADELELKIERIKEDTRINLGKWVLANLFRGLILAEEEEVTSRAPPTPSLSSISTAVPSPMTHAQLRVQLPGMSIPINRLPNSPGHRKRAMSESFSSTARSGAINIPGLLNPSARPVVLSEIPIDVLSKSAPEEKGIVQAFQVPVSTPRKINVASLDTSTTIATTNTLTPSNEAPSNPNGNASTSRDKDYFSLRRKNEGSPSMNLERIDGANGNGKVTPSTPVGLMGKLKNFGKKKQSDSLMQLAQEKVPIVETHSSQDTQREAEQFKILDMVRSYSFHPPPPWEAPLIFYPPDTVLLISEDSRDAGAWVTTYRSRVSDTGRDIHAIEMNSPKWLLECLFANQIRVKEPVKISFVLRPYPGSNMPELPGGNGRLNASRSLRAKRIYQFVADQINQITEKSRSSFLVHTRRPSQSTQPRSGSSLGDKPMVNLPQILQKEDFELFLCDDPKEVPIDPNLTLNTLKTYYGGGSGDIHIFYLYKDKGQSRHGTEMN
ncbi:hypothetical protein L204_106343 [Cryptococcus depauperatus]|nr:hypothetical protein L204_06263 [Cryptococcus depauperatus CBS 7855]